MRGVEYIPIETKSAINRVTGMPFGWSLNPYRGCVHACHYCYARATHSYFGLDAGRDFETKVFVKTGIAAVLERELARPSWKGEQIAIGTATDAYQPIEGRERLTRACLEVLLAARNPIGIVTKSTLVLRDTELLAQLNQVARVRVYITLTTLDRDLWRSLEPGTPPPAQRLEALRRLNEAGVPSGVLVAPILPGITDSDDAMRSVIDAAAERGAVAVHGSPLRLAPLVKEHYYGWVEQNVPELLGKYRAAYFGTNASAGYQADVMRRFDALRAPYGYQDEPRYWPNRVVDTDPPKTTQLSLAF